MEWKYAKFPPTEEDVRRMERHFGYQMPEWYVRKIMSHHGARPLRSRFDTSAYKGREVKSFLPITEQFAGNVYQVHGWIKERLLPNMVPFASEAAGNYLCFHYDSDEEHQPSIIMWNHEHEYDFEWVCADFGAFMSGLY